MKPKSLQNSVSKRGTVVESFFCQLSSQLGSHFWSLGLSIGARKTVSKGFLGLKKNRLGNVFCGRAIPSKKLYAQREIRE